MTRFGWTIPASESELLFKVIQVRGICPAHGFKGNSGIPFAIVDLVDYAEPPLPSGRSTVNRLEIRDRDGPGLSQVSKRPARS